MGREIKFKAWYKPLGVMIEPKKLEMINFEVKVLGVYLELDGKGFNKLRMSDFELLQYTGLKDKNGREIYEGDILTSEEYPFQDDGQYNYHGLIEWIDEEASFYMTKRLANPEKRGVSNGISEPIYSIEEFEVIGNLFDNPELLEV